MSEKCPVCGSKLKNSQSSDYGRQYEYACPKCGCFSLNKGLNNYLLGGESGLADRYDISKLKSSLFYYLRVIRHNFLEDKVTLFGFVESNASNFGYANVDHVYKLYPQTIDSRIDMVMQLFHTEIKDFGERCYILKNWNALAYRYCLSNDDRTSTPAEEIWNVLYSLKYFSGQRTGFTFSPKGWEKIDSLKNY